MPRFTLSPDSARRLAVAGLSAAATDDTVPMLTGAHIRLIDATGLLVEATDQYRIHVARIDLAEPSASVTYDLGTFPPAALKWLRTNARYFSRRSRITDTTQPTVVVTISRGQGSDVGDMLTIDVIATDGVSGVSWVGPLLPGDWPARVMEQVIEARNAEPVSQTANLKLDLLGAATVLGERPSVKFTEKAGSDYGPIYAAFTDQVDGRAVLYAEAVIMPAIV